MNPVQDSSPPPPVRRTWLLPLGVVMIGSFMAVLDTSIVNVAIPTIQNELGASADQAEWIATGYILALGVVVPVSGWLGDRYGLDRIQNIALILFVLGSALCGIASNVDEMIAFRILQAAGGGLLPAVSQAMVYRIVPRRQIGTAMGIYGLGVVFAPALGPTVGGYLVQYVNWRLIYFINVPIGILGAVLSVLVLPRFARIAGQRFDLAGWVTIAVGLFALLLAMSEGERWHWNSYAVLLLLALGGLSLALFVVIELSVEQPMLELRLFRLPSFAISAALVGLLVTGLFASLYFVPLFLQQGQQLGAFETGLTLLPPALVTVVMMPLSGVLYDRFGARWPAAVGMLLVAFATYLMHGISPQTSRGQIMLWLAIRNLGMGTALMPIITGSLAVVPAALVSRASAISNIVQRVSSALGLALLGSVLGRQEAQQYNDRAALVPGVAPGSPDLHAIATQGPAGILRLYQAAQGQVFGSALGDVFLLVAGLTALGVPLALFLPGRRSAAVEGRAEQSATRARQARQVEWRRRDHRDRQRPKQGAPAQPEVAGSARRRVSGRRR